MVRHWTPKPAIISCTRSSPTGGNFFFAVVKFFKYKIAISANFVQTVKNSIIMTSVLFKWFLYKLKKTDQSGHKAFKGALGTQYGKSWGFRVRVYFWKLLEVANILPIEEYSCVCPNPNTAATELDLLQKLCDLKRYYSVQSGSKTETAVKCLQWTADFYWLSFLS